jgi:Flp pilus assembly protein TadD
MTTGPSARIARAALPLLLALAVLAVYWPVARFPFIGFDDDVYVTRNAWVLAEGFGAADVAHAFTTFTGGNWHPVTMLSHKLDVALFGVSPGAFHAENALIHLAATLLLFRLFRRTTGRPVESAAVAALFAIHPLHVESVAWISERKDVLCAFFTLLSLGAWARYAETGSARRYLAAFGWAVAAMLSKPMAVTLPVMLLLFDGWPLGRLRGLPPERPGAPPGGIRRALLEKVPFLAASLAVGVATLAAQREGGAVSGVDLLPVGARLSNALVSYGWYLAKAAWPAGLSVFYPYPAVPHDAWKVAGSALGLAAVTALSIRESRRRPYLLFGWLWYLATLLPVIGLVQAGAQGAADRYSYLPLVGIFAMAAWGVSGLLPASAAGRRAVAAAATLALAAAGYAASRQVETWRSTEALFARALDVTADNWLAHDQLGYRLWETGRAAEAVPHLREAVRIRPDYPKAHHNLGLALAALGATDEAAGQFGEAVGLAPADASSRRGLGVALARGGRIGEAVVQFREAVRLRPDDAGGITDLAAALLQSGNSVEAERWLREAIRIAPDRPEAHHLLGVALAGRGERAEAASRFREALRLKPDHEPARAGLDRLGR